MPEILPDFLYLRPALHKMQLHPRLKTGQQKWFLNNAPVA